MKIKYIEKNSSTSAHTAVSVLIPYPREIRTLERYMWSQTAKVVRVRVNAVLLLL